MTPLTRHGKAAFPQRSTPFDQRVLALVQSIPAGKVATYRQVARLLGSRGCRAVGQALRRNPHPVTVPCHRVVLADGRVGGYAGRFGTRKARLLRQEGVQIRDGRIDLRVYGWKR
ncbi:MAG: MGMT family protein [Candidatus Aenigmarchaeota archaeon]|nr:MGMT family protein [Candidatus Aenigmarchaeota archaeon]